MQLMQAQHSSSLTASLTMLFLAPVPFREMAHPCASEHGDFPEANMTQFVRLGLVPEKKTSKTSGRSCGPRWRSSHTQMIGLEAQTLLRRSYAKLCEANHLLSSSITQRVSIAISRNAWHLLRMRGFPNGTSFWFWSLARSVSFSWQYISILWGTSKMSFEFTCSVSRSLRSSGSFLSKNSGREHFQMSDSGLISFGLSFLLTHSVTLHKSAVRTDGVLRIWEGRPPGKMHHWICSICDSLQHLWITSLSIELPRNVVLQLCMGRSGRWLVGKTHTTRR